MISVFMMNVFFGIYFPSNMDFHSMPMLIDADPFA